MTTFDKLKGAAATLADAAVKTTGDLAQKGKKQMDLLALENKLSRAQRQLGALVYALHKNGEENTALVERYIETIAAVEKDIAALEPAPAAATADDAHGVYPPARRGGDPHAIFCPGCGANCNGPKMRFAVIRRRKNIVAGAPAPEKGARRAFSSFGVRPWRMVSAQENGSAQFGATDVKSPRMGANPGKKGQTTCKVRAIM
ncbi:MAG: hypothetical protein ACLSWY_14600 [Ruthenibacterium lactatiformans]